MDHVIPEETLGWSEADNLEVLCMFCNSGKQAYRRPLEAISSFAVGALADTPHGRNFNQLKLQIVVAALRSQTSGCIACGRPKTEAELTVTPVLGMSDGSMHGFAPWNLKTLCYSCLAALPEDNTYNLIADLPIP